MNKTLLFATAILSICLASCTEPEEPQAVIDNLVPTVIKEPCDLNSLISIFEIPALDLSRAATFYKGIMDLDIEEMEMEGMKIGIFPYEGQMVTGVIIQGEGYKPSAEGLTIYLNAGENLQTILDKVEPNGGEIILPKTPHGDNSGFFALFLDSEGNRMGLNSPK